MYKSNKLIFSKIDKADAWFFKSLKDESWMMTHQKTINNGTDQENWVSNLDSDSHSPKELVLIVKHEIADKIVVIGLYKIHNVDYINRTADVGWDLLEGERGKGLGKLIVAGGANFCFDILNLRRLNAEILQTNIPSQKCAKAAGFVLEGVKRESVHKPDGFVDSQVWGLLKTDRVK